MSDNTPMMKQYISIKEQHKDAVLFFRMGDFYEMFKSDAVEVSRILNLTLTKRNGIQMCGIPYHAASNYIGRLLKAGKKIAICEQTAMPEKGKGIATREVVEIVTPGTVVDENYLDKKNNNYLAALGKIKDTYSFAFLDLSTAEFFVTSFPEDQIIENIRKEIFRISPGEILVQEELLEDKRFRFLQQGDFFLNSIENWRYDLRSSLVILKQHFSTVSMKGFGFTDEDFQLLSAGVLLSYIEETAKSVLPHIRSLKAYSDKDFLSLDEATQKNLELVRNLQNGGSHYTLLEILDESITSMGGRHLRNWILHPLCRVDEIKLRQNRISSLYKDQRNLMSIRDCLKSVSDIERLSARVAMDKAHARDLLSLKSSIQQFGIVLNLASSVKDLLNDQSGQIFDNASLGILDQELKPLWHLLERAIQEEPSILLTEGRLIKEEYDAELDRLRTLKNNSRKLLEAYLEEEKKLTGIHNLKIKYNKIIGHFFEVSKGQLSLIPEHFIRRQSLVNAERFSTDKLSSIEVELNNASDNILELEKNLFIEIRASVKEKLAELQAVGLFFAELDSYQSLAYVATVRGYHKPTINENADIRIIMGRHPVVEAHLPPGEFVPNHSLFNQTDRSFSLITGPNMAGKSTYLRQTALLVLMAQIGSFIPAQEAEIGVVDKIFCRVGATDNLARGESTFLVEMNETSNILRNSTDRSLIIMDEVGRGTSTEDGLSIAWAISEYLMEQIGAKTLFATHYHELTQMESPKMINLSLEVREEGEKISFLKRLVESPSNNSYGIHVASLAGIPENVIERAREILRFLENRKKGNHPQEGMKPPKETKRSLTRDQFDLFSREELVQSELKGLDLDKTTPLDALNLLARWKKEWSE